MRVSIDATGAFAGGINRVLVQLSTTLVRPAYAVTVRNIPYTASAALKSSGVEVAGTQPRSRAATVARALVPRLAHCDALIRIAPSLASHPRAGCTVTIVHDLAFAHDWSAQLGAIQRRYRRRALKFCVRNSDLLLCVSEATRQELHALYPAANTRTATVLPSVSHVITPPTPALPRMAADRRGLELVMFGHGPNKGLHLALEALQLDQNVGLTVFARRTQLAAYGVAAEAAQAEAAGQLSVVEDASDEEIARRVVGADVFVMPSRYEGFGLPAAEAMWLGVPTVISPLPTLREATRGGAVEMESLSAAALLSAVNVARSRPTSAWADARETIRTWTWADYTESIIAEVEDLRARRSRRR